MLMNSILKFVLLVLPYAFMVLGFSIYDRATPYLGGMPFFYWYQILWIFLAAILTSIVYFIESRESKGRVSA
jgi:cell division protein FtsW (lipid II flippase)